MRRTLEDAFTLRMFEIYRDAKTQAKYAATIFYNMVAKNGGLATARTLINSTKPSDGYTALYERGRLDLTVEAVVVEEQIWHPLFSVDELKMAKDRLKKYGYTLK